MQTWRLAPGEYYTERARTALRDYRFLSAIDYALKAVKYETQNPSVYYYLGRARVLGGDWQQSPEAGASYYEAAVPAFAKARELAPLDKTYTLELAFTYDALGRFNEAEWLYYEARALDPRSTSTNRYYQAHLERWKNGGIESPTKNLTDSKKLWPLMRKSLGEIRTIYTLKKRLPDFALPLTLRTRTSRHRGHTARFNS